MQKILESLIYTPSVAGVETKMALLLQSLIGECFDETYYDNANNLVFHKQGKGEKIMLCTCLDTPGIIVTGVEEQKVHIAPLGSLEPTSSNQRTVRFENGAIGLLHCEKVTSDTKLCDFTVELFDKSKTVEVGEKGVFDADFVSLSKSVFAGFGLAGKACVLSLIEAAKSMSGSDKDIYFVFCSQTSLGFRSSAPASNTVKPDVVYAIGTQKASFGKLFIRVFDKSFTADGELVRNAEKAMKDVGAEYALSAKAELVSQCSKIAGTQKGCAVCQLDMPVKYHNTSRECISLEDVSDMAKVILQLLK